MIEMMLNNSSEQGHLVAFTTNQGNERLWVIDSSDFSVVANLDIGASSNSKCRFSPDGRFLAVANNSAPYLWVFDTIDWTQVGVQNPGSPLSALLAFSHEGSMLASVFGSNVVIYDTSTWLRITAFAVDATPTSIAFSPDDSELVVGVNTTASGALRVIDTSSWNYQSIPSSSVTQVNRIAFSPDGALLAVGRAVSPYTVVLETENYTPLHTAALPSGTVYDVVFSPDGEYFVSSGLPAANQVRTVAFPVNNLSATFQIMTPFRVPPQEMAFKDGIFAAAGGATGSFINKVTKKLGVLPDHTLDYIPGNLLSVDIIKK